MLDAKKMAVVRGYGRREKMVMHGLTAGQENVPQRALEKLHLKRMALEVDP